MSVIQAKDYYTRGDLEAFVAGQFRLTTEAKPDWKITGKREELSRLQLSDRTLFWGITCEVSDTPTERKLAAKVDRGEKHPFGINIKKDDK